MSDADPLLALLELMLRTFTAQQVPKVKPGGHPDEIFVDLTDEERDSLECSICYQILKEVRQCENRHKFCNSCIFVWSTSGHPINHGRCPVCRADGIYKPNNELDELINSKKVKCSLKSCKWRGALKLLSNHQHTTYSDPVRLKQAGVTADDKTTTGLPSVSNAPTQRPNSAARSRSLSSRSESTTTSSPQISDASTAQTQRPALGTLNNSSSNNNNSTSNNTQQNTRSTNRSTTRSRTRSRPRQNSSSPQRRSNVSTTGLNTRLTNRARINNNGTVESQQANAANTNPSSRPRAASNRTASSPSTGNETNANATEQTTVEEIHVPHPPTTPRPAMTPRRLPTLPGMIGFNNGSRTTDSNNAVTDSNNNVSENPTSAEVNTSAESPRHFYMQATIRRPAQLRSFGTIRERLNESRQRLDMLMSVFSTELDRGRQDLTSFQEERERRRQEQLAEVRELGNRLSQVAAELRGLLSQRRQIRTQMDNLLGSSSDD